MSLFRYALRCAVLCSGTLFSCYEAEELPALEIVYPYPERSVALSDQRMLARNREGVPVLNGGYGSSMALAPGEEGAFFFLTDRGPVARGAQPGEVVFIAKRFNPHIAKYKLTGDSLRLVSRITLRLPTGDATGIPPPAAGEEFGPNAGTTGETALDSLGEVLEPDPLGIDPEGLCLAPDASFWISEEYGPSLLHFGRGGGLLERISPFTTGEEEKSLPRVLVRRKPGKGLEGLCMSPDGSKLIAIMQSALNNPGPEAGTASRNVRLVVLDLASGETMQYIYQLNSSSTNACEILYLSDIDFLVLERDEAFPGDPAAPAPLKHVYRISLGGATEVSDPDDGALGRLYAGKTLEEMSDAELEQAGVRPVSKELLIDLLAAYPDYPHDKPEGMALIGGRKLLIVNDDDYGIQSFDPPNGQYQAKLLPPGNQTDKTVLYFIDLPAPVLP